MHEENGKLKRLDAANRYLTFFIDKEQYGIHISKIKEIIAPMHITHIPKTPPFVKGVINFRGVIIAVVDIRLKFDMQERPMDSSTAIIIYGIEETSVGFIVDRVEDVLSIEEEHIAETPHFNSAIDTLFIENVAEVGDDVIMLLDLEKMFEENELLEMHNLETKNQNKGKNQ